MVHDAEFTTLFIYAVFITANANYDPNMDNVLFSMNWPGDSDIKVTTYGSGYADINKGNALVMTTAANEKYRCYIPNVDDDLNSKNLGNEYDGPSEYELLAPLLDQTSCSYRIETYWTYELCHGKHLRQYHEEKEINKKPKLQEYFLGKFDRKSYESNINNSPDTPGEGNEESRPDLVQSSPKQKVMGFEISYFALNYTGGTNCDLTGHPRRASIRYVCQEDGKGEIYELKEMSTCEYEVVILTSTLCSHPSYGPKKDPVNKIQCHSLDGSPRKPKSLLELEEDSASSRFNRKEFWEAPQKEEAEAVVPPAQWWDDDEDGEDELDDDLDDEEESKPRLKPEVPKKETTSYTEKERPNTVISSSTDKQLVNEFLRGEYCIQGGTGWWKHEFCYGKKVIQFHEDRVAGRTIITLGQWDEEEHKAWLRKNPNKKPKPTADKKSLSQFYGLGDVCDLTKRQRVVEVKLKCKENPSQPHSVAIYLIEPSTCEYILVVESSILCDVIEKADEFGLVHVPKIP